MASSRMLVPLMRDARCQVSRAGDVSSSWGLRIILIPLGRVFDDREGQSDFEVESAPTVAVDPAVTIQAGRSVASFEWLVSFDMGDSVHSAILHHEICARS